MLAGERFSDHPRTSCPAISAFLRGYNDNVDDARRQDLIPLAADLVGSRADSGTTEERAERLHAFGAGLRRYRWQSFGPGHANRVTQCEAVGGYVGRRARRRPEVHGLVLEFVRSLLVEAAPDPQGAGPSEAGRAETEPATAA